MNDEWLEVTFPHLKKLKNIGVGDGFGEISLLTNTTRTATVICNEVTQMLAINKSTFVNLSKMFVIDDLDKKLTFFKSFSLLNGLPPNELLSLMYATEKKIYKINEKIYDYG
jgi:cAMP-dependent protein kinase regulator